VTRESAPASDGCIAQGNPESGRCPGREISSLIEIPETGRKKGSTVRKGSV